MAAAKAVAPDVTKTAEDGERSARVLAAWQTIVKAYNAGADPRQRTHIHVHPRGWWLPHVNAYGGGVTASGDAIQDTWRCRVNALTPPLQIPADDDARVIHIPDALLLMDFEWAGNFQHYFLDCFWVVAVVHNVLSHVAAAVSDGTQVTLSVLAPCVPWGADALAAVLPPHVRVLTAAQYGRSPLCADVLLTVPLHPPRNFVRCAHVLAPVRAALAALQAATAVPRAVGDAPAAACRKIWLDRAEASDPLGRCNAGRSRALVNHDACAAGLAARGFERVLMEGLPLGQRAAALAGARVIVTPFGANCMNLVWAPTVRHVFVYTSPTFAVAGWFQRLLVEPLPPVPGGASSPLWSAAAAAASTRTGAATAACSQPPLLPYATLWESDPAWVSVATTVADDTPPAVAVNSPYVMDVPRVLAWMDAALAGADAST